MIDSTEAVVEAEHISKVVPDGDAALSILDDVNLCVHAGEGLALMGASGSGKSTLLNILGGLDESYSGRVRYGDMSLSSLSDSKLAHFRNQSLGFVFQAFNLLGHLSVLENVMLPARFRKERIDSKDALSLLSRVGLVDKVSRLPETLSGGERQRVAIARALLAKPALLLCDEPTGNLDEAATDVILALFEELLEDGVTMIIATHSNDVAQRLNRTLFLKQGRVAE